MTHPRIASIAEAFPEHYYPQQDLIRALQELWRDAPVDPASIERVHRNTTVRGRHLARPLAEYAPGTPWGQVNREWIRIASHLGEQAVGRALEDAYLHPSDVGSIVFVTVTGLATPSVDALVANRLRLPATVRRTPIFGLGCVAGAAGLARCAEMARSDPSRAVVLLSVELCSLTFQFRDHSMGNLIAAGLFGDGAAAVALVGDGQPARGPCVVDSRSILYRDTESVMGWEFSETGFQLVLSPEIPELIRANVRKDVDTFLARNDLKRGDVAEWIVHTGGPKVFAAIEESLELPADALDATRATLARVGNLSSTSVLVVLKETIDRRQPAPGTWGLMLAVGPGFCLEMVLLRW